MGSGPDDREDGAARHKPGGGESLNHPDPSVRLAVVIRVVQSRAEGTGWVDALLSHLERETDPEVVRQIVRAIAETVPGRIAPLEAHLQGSPVATRRLASRAFGKVLGDPDLFSEAFSGLLSPHDRGMAEVLRELAQTDPDRTARVLAGCLFSRDLLNQQVGLVSLLEIDEQQALPLLADFPEELVLSDAAERYREVRSSFDLRRYFRNAAVPYFPLRCLGEGGMGAVYLSRDLKRPPRLAALKFLKPGADGTLEPEQVVRFEREARVPLLLSHPGLMRVTDLDFSGELKWIDTDFIHGETLQDLLRRDGTTTWETAVPIVREIAGALDYLHRRRIVHRDLKPANLFLARDPPRVILGDFGLVQIEDPDLQSAVPNYTPTQAHVIMGTIGYMSPEQCTTRPLDGRSDLFALGVVLYQMLEGRLPFSASSAGEYLAAVAGPCPPRPPRSDLPEGAWAFLQRLLEKDPNARFPNGSAVLAALQQVGSGVPGRPPEEGLGGGMSGAKGPPSRTIPPGDPAGPETQVAPLQGRPTCPARSLDRTSMQALMTSAPALETTGSRGAPDRTDAPDGPPRDGDVRTLMARSPGAGAAPGREPTIRVDQPAVRLATAPATPVGPAVSSSGDVGAPSICRYCRQPIAAPGAECFSCLLAALPVAPWLMSWALFAAALFLVVPWLGAPRFVLGLRSPVPVELGSLLVASGALLVARGLRAGRGWAYVTALVTTGLTAIAVLGLSGAVRFLPTGRFPAAVHDAVQRAGVLQQSGLPLDLWVAWVRDQRTAYLEAAGLLLLLLFVQGLSGRSREHFAGKIGPGSVVWLGISLALIVGPVVAHAVGK
ncbi:MAG: protein kinase [Candidatus Riflebacteria bacterium]|nr:protein kinase [Candidatus Riflebacteria bacterium]